MLPNAVGRAVHVLEPAEHLRPAFALANLLAIVARIGGGGRLGLQTRPDALGVLLPFLRLGLLGLLLHPGLLGGSLGGLLLLLPGPLPPLLVGRLVLLLLDVILREGGGDLGPAVPVAMLLAQGGPGRSEGVADLLASESGI